MILFYQVDLVKNVGGKMEDAGGRGGVQLIYWCEACKIRDKAQPLPSHTFALLAITEWHGAERLLEKANAYTAGVMKKWEI